MTYQQPRRSRANLFAVLGIALVLVVGAVVAVVVTSGGDDDTGGRSAPTSTASRAEVRLAAERDAAVKAGTEIAATFNSLDYRKVDDGLDRWESLSTGALLDEVRASRGRTADAITQAKSVSEARVLDAALAELDADAGTARLLAALHVDVTVAGQESAKRLRIRLDLERTPAGWKASGIDSV